MTSEVLGFLKKLLDVANDYHDVLGLLGALVGGVFALCTYAKAEAWKRTEYAAQKLDELWHDERLRFCCLTLDWARRKVAYFDDYRPLMTEESGSVSTSFVHCGELLASALQAEGPGAAFSWAQVQYRDSFDRFLEYLGNVNTQLTRRLYALEDIRPIFYWIRQLVEPRFMRREDSMAILRFAAGYGYTGAIELIDRILRLQREETAAQGNRGFCRWCGFWRPSQSANPQLLEIDRLLERVRQVRAAPQA